MNARARPVLGPGNSAYWTAGRTGTLQLAYCSACDFYVHPPSPVCPNCLGEEVGPQPVSGRGTVYTFTVNHQQWLPGLEVPYVIALVELEEQVGLRILTNLVGCDPEDVRIGMAVKVGFDQDEDVFVPIFYPVDA